LAKVNSSLVVDVKGFRNKGKYYLSWIFNTWASVAENGIPYKLLSSISDPFILFKGKLSIIKVI